MNTPLVSISCISYNHARYIRKTIEGFLMQEPPTGVSADEPWYEILIHDDASTDGTTEIIKEYEAKYPDRIFPLYETENQYKKGMAGRMETFNYNRARGAYIAYCEGDDYWTDPKKLQKQVDFMEAHPDYSICLHGCTVNNERSNQQFRSHEFDAYAVSNNPNKTKMGIDMTMEDYFRGNFGQPLSMVMRVSMFDFNWHKRFKYYRDMHEFYYLLKSGKGYWMNFDGGVYTIHDGGVSGSLNRHGFCEVSLPIDREFYWKTFAPCAKLQYTATLEECIRVYAKEKPMKAYWLAFVLLIVSKHPRSMVRSIKTIKRIRKQ